MKKITKRELVAFFLGIFTILLIDAALDWEGTKMALKQGYEDGRASVSKMDSR